MPLFILPSGAMTYGDSKESGDFDEIVWAASVAAAFVWIEARLAALGDPITDDPTLFSVEDGVRSLIMSEAFKQVAAENVALATAPTGTQTLFAWDSATEEPTLVTASSGSGIDPTTLNANTILYAVTDDTPAALSVGASTVVGRAASGNIVALTATELRTILAAAIPTPLTALTGFVDAAGQNRQAYRSQAGTFNVCSLKMPAAGKIIQVSVDQTAARTAGTATHTVYKNGSSTAITAVIDGTNTTHVVGTAGSVAFAAGDLLDTRQSVSGYTGTAAYEATIWVQFDAS